MSENNTPYRQEDRKRDDFMENPGTRTVTAIILIGLGIVFLLNQAGTLTLSGNWWAFFIAIPAVTLLYSTYQGYVREGRITPAVGSSLMGGLIFAGIAFMAWFDAWDWLLPYVLIVIGVSMLLGWRNPDRREQT